MLLRICFKSRPRKTTIKTTKRRLLRVTNTATTSISRPASKSETVCMTLDKSSLCSLSLIRPRPLPPTTTTTKFHSILFKPHKRPLNLGSRLVKKRTRWLTIRSSRGIRRSCETSMTFPSRRSRRWLAIKLEMQQLARVRNSFKVVSLQQRCPSAQPKAQLLTKMS